MIWTPSGIVQDHALSISVLDRTFEHGLGLFETMRTWNGRASLLPRHLQRLKNTAETLNLPLDPASLPTHHDVQALVHASGITGDARLRLVASGGTPDGQPCSVWLRCWPLEPGKPHMTVGFQWFAGQLLNPLGEYKTLNYWGRRRLIEFVQKLDWVDEILLFDPTLTTYANDVWEGTHTNLFAVRHDAQGPKLITPRNGPYHILQGLMRQVVLERARDAGFRVEVNRLTIDDVRNADEVFLTNAVRGIIPVGRLHGPEDRDLDAPGPVTKRLWESHVLPWLERGGDTPS